jgi:hypothetical protein
MLSLVQHGPAQRLATILVHSHIRVHHDIARPACRNLEQFVLPIILFFDLLTEQLLAAAATENEFVSPCGSERTTVTRDVKIRALTLGAFEAELHQ